jgi:ABC-type glycerol-3-phosphate transport system substrate-binding protein
MKKFSKMAFGLALVGAVCAMLLAPAPAMADWADKAVTITGAGYYVGNNASTDTNKMIYITFTYSSTTYTRFSRASLSDINQQLATALTALSNGGAAVIQFNQDDGTAYGIFYRIRAGN